MKEETNPRQVEGKKSLVELVLKMLLLDKLSNRARKAIRIGCIVAGSIAGVNSGIEMYRFKKADNAYINSSSSRAHLKCLGEYLSVKSSVEELKKFQRKYHLANAEQERRRLNELYLEAKKRLDYSEKAEKESVEYKEWEKFQNWSSASRTLGGIFIGLPLIAGGILTYVPKRENLKSMNLKIKINH